MKNRLNRRRRQWMGMLGGMLIGVSMTAQGALTCQDRFGAQWAPYLKRHNVSTQWNAFYNARFNGSNINALSGQFEQQQCNVLRGQYRNRMAFRAFYCDFERPAWQTGSGFGATTTNPARVRVEGCQLKVRRGTAVGRPTGLTPTDTGDDVSRPARPGVE